MLYILYAKKRKKNKFIKEIGDKIYDKEIEEKDKKDSSIYNFLKDKLNKENSFILLDNNFDENYKNLKQGDSIKIVIGRCSDKNIIEERIKLLNQKNIIYKEIEYLFDDKDNEHQDRDQFEKNKKLDKDFIDKLIMNNNRDSNLYITGQTISSLSIKKNSIPSVFFSYIKLNFIIPRNISNYSKFFPFEYVNKNNKNFDLEHIKNKNICFVINNINCINDYSYKYINEISLENLIELNIEFNIKSYAEENDEEIIFNSTIPTRLPNLKNLKCVNFFPNFYGLTNIVKIEYKVINKYDVHNYKIICDYFEKEFPFITAFFRGKLEFNEMLSDFENNNIHINLKYIHLSYNSDFINRLYKRNFEKNKLKINEYNIDNLNKGNLIIPHNISDNFSSIKIVDFNEKYYENQYNKERERQSKNYVTNSYHSSYNASFHENKIIIPFEQHYCFTLYIQEDPLKCKIKEIYFPFLSYKNVIQNCTIKIHSYKMLEKIFLYIYDFDFIDSKLFDDDDNIKLINIRKVYLCFWEIDIDVFKIKIKNFLKKVTNNISSIIISIINTKEYCNTIKKYIFSLPFIAENNKIKNKIIIVKKKKPTQYEKGKYIFKYCDYSDEDDEIDECEEYNSDNEFMYYDDDLYFSEDKFNEKKRMKKNKKKKIKHHKFK